MKKVNIIYILIFSAACVVATNSYAALTQQLNCSGSGQLDGEKIGEGSEFYFEKNADDSWVKVWGENLEGVVASWDKEIGLSTVKNIVLNPKFKSYPGRSPACPKLGVSFDVAHASPTNTAMEHHEMVIDPCVANRFDSSLSIEGTDHATFFKPDQTTLTVDFEIRCARANPTATGPF